MKWLRALFRKSGTNSQQEMALTAEKLEHVFQWSRLNGPHELGAGQAEFERATGLRGYFGSSISISREAMTFTIRREVPHYRVGETVSTPPFIKFFSAPEFAYISIAPGGVQVRYCKDTGAPFTYCPVTTDPAVIRRLEVIFDFWYRRLDLPRSLTVPGPTRREVNRSDKLTLIRGYLDDGSVEYFHDVFRDNDPVVWIDHREADDDIVSLIAGMLGLDSLTGELTADDGRFGMKITYGSKSLEVSYPQPHADRDSTIIALNGLLKPDYEIRWCLASDGGDTLAFLALPQAQWAALEKSHPEQVAALFGKIAPGTVMFGS